MENKQSIQCGSSACWKKYFFVPYLTHVHMLRWTHATSLYRKGIAVEDITSALGYTSIQTTKDHYVFPSFVQKQEVVKTGGVIITEVENQEWPDDKDDVACICGLRSTILSVLKKSSYIASEKRTCTDNKSLRISLTRWDLWSSQYVYHKIKIMYFYHTDRSGTGNV